MVAVLAFYNHLGQLEHVQNTACFFMNPLSSFPPGLIPLFTKVQYNPADIANLSSRYGMQRPHVPRLLGTCTWSIHSSVSLPSLSPLAPWILPSARVPLLASV